MNKKRPGLAHLKKFYSTSALYIPSLWLNLCRYWKGKKKYFWKDKNKIKRWNKERKLKNFHFVFDRDDDDPVGRRSKMRFKKLNYWFQSLPPSLPPPPSSSSSSLVERGNHHFKLPWRRSIIVSSTSFIHYDVSATLPTYLLTYLSTYLHIYLTTYLYRDQ